jgi:hypothetical protein
MRPSPDQSESREYFRVRTRIRVGMRAVTPAEAEAITREIAHREPGYSTRIDFELAEWLARIERKLELVLRKLGDEGEAGSLPSEELDIVLSGNGLSVPARDPKPLEGQHVLVELHLTGSPLRPVRALAIAVRRVAQDPAGSLPLALCAIHESDRDSIIRHCIAVERRTLRDHRPATEAE